MSTTSPLASIDDDQLATMLAEHGTKQALADHLQVSPSTLKDTLSRRGIASTTSKPRKHATGKLTRDALHAALLPPNNCRLKAFRDQLDDDEQAVLDEALAYDRNDFPASRIRDLLISVGYPEPNVPGVDAINAHRSGKRPCRCKG